MESSAHSAQVESSAQMESSAQIQDIINEPNEVLFNSIKRQTPLQQQQPPQPQHWILRIGNGKNFTTSSKFKTWGIKTTTDPTAKYFIKTIKKGDILWFVKQKNQGLVLAVATYEKHVERELGLVNLTKTDEELGWQFYENCNIEIHYSNLRNLSNLELLTCIKSQITIRKYNEKCKLNLPEEYANIIKYSKVTNEF